MKEKLCIGTGEYHEYVVVWEFFFLIRLLSFFFLPFPTLKMGRISPNIKEGAKVSVLGPVVSESIARPLLGES